MLLIQRVCITEQRGLNEWVSCIVLCSTCEVTYSSIPLVSIVSMNALCNVNAVIHIYSTHSTCNTHGTHITHSAHSSHITHTVHTVHTAHTQCTQYTQHTHSAHSTHSTHSTHDTHWHTQYTQHTRYTLAHTVHTVHGAIQNSLNREQYIFTLLTSFQTRQSPLVTCPNAFKQIVFVVSTSCFHNITHCVLCIRFIMGTS